MFQGLYTALITPFKNGKVDARAFGDLVEWQIKEGVHGLVPCGSTGESPTLSTEEHQRVIELCVEAAAGRVKIMAGTGSNSTDKAIAMTRFAKKAGADGVLSIAPYYNKPTQEGLYRHFKAIHDAVNIPIVLYNVPARVIVDISDETIARLSVLPNIVGIKDATGDLARPLTLRAKLSPPRKRGERFALLSGEDMTAVAFNASGGVGCISVSSNIIPKACAEVQNACLRGDFKKALALSDKLTELHDVMFCETNPAPVKFAASLLGRCSPELRLPLVPLSENGKKQMRRTLKNLHLI
jgi:4-hydroxy-tetrahydrodipicolinate synthase